MSKAGGCDNDARGQASSDRSVMESEGIRDSPAYHAYSETIHCPDTHNSDCERQEAVQPFLGKYDK